MASLASVRIENYRCFQDHTVEFGPISIIVGKNNAGKSTLIETLRLVSIGLRRFQNITSVAAPEWLDDLRVGRGQRIDLKRLGLWAPTIFHRYGDPPARIQASFSDQSKLDLFMGPDGEAHAIFYASDGRAVRYARDLGGGQTPRVNILPQIVPLEREEKVLVPEYVKSHLDSYLASRHFRNQLNLLQERHFDAFRALVEASWPGIRVQSFEGQGGPQGTPLELMIRDGGFVAEAGWMGHGLQMWLQTLWFIVRTRDGGSIVLDEPDVYMHPDLQRRLIRLLRSQHRDLVIATHSTEILAEVDPTNVLVLDRDLRKSTYAIDLPAVQRVVDGIGSAQNLQIARLWKAKSLVLVEGDDMKVLKRVHDLLFPSSDLPLDAIPNWSIGGWTGWHRAVASVVALHNSVDERIRAYCILDSDYHLDEEKAKRIHEAQANQIELHILSMKEIENYLVIPSLVQRVIGESVSHSVRPPTIEDVARQIDGVSLGLLNDAQDCYVTEFHLANRRASPAEASKQARELVAAKVARPRGALGVVSGKDVLSRLSAWSSAEFGVSFGVGSLIRMMRRHEVDNELGELVAAITAARPFPPVGVQ